MHPRKVPGNTEFVGDQACAQCHQKMVAGLSHSAMGMAMEPVPESKVLKETESGTRSNRDFQPRAKMYN